MRVTVICSVYPPAMAPEAPHAALLCQHLAKAGCDVTLITSPREDGSTPTHPDYTIRANMNRWDWGGMSLLKRELEESRPDAVLLIYLSWIYGRHPMITFLPSICRKLSTKPRCVIQFENTPGADPKKFTHRLFRKLMAMRVGQKGLEYRYGTMLRDSSAIIALCRPHLADVAKYYPPVTAKAVVIPAPALLKIVEDPDGAVRRRTRQRLGYADSDFVVCYFGYIYPEKGVETVIEGAGAALATTPNLRLLMIGGTPGNLAARDPGYPQRVKDLAATMGLADRTIWTGHCDPEADAASEYLHAADAIVMPFIHGIRLNNSSYAVVTSHSLPVITTRGPDLEPEFMDRKNVMLCPPGDAKAFGAAIAEVAADRSLRDALRAGATEFSQGKSSWPAVVRQTIAVMKGERS